MQNVDWVVEWSAVLHKVVKAINTTKSSQEWGGYYNYHLKQENTYTNWRGQLSQHPIDVALKIQQRGFFLTFERILLHTMLVIQYSKMESPN